MKFPISKPVVAWVWSVFATIMAIGAFATGSYLAGVLLGISVAVTMPALQPLFAKQSISIPTWVPIVVAVGAVLLSPVGQRSPPAGQQVASAPKPDVASAAAQPENDASVKLKALSAKVPDATLPHLTRDGYPKMYARLGASAFKKADELARWAGIAAAESDACGTVSAVGMSDKATRSNLLFFVNCSSDEQYLVNQKQASAAQTRYNPEATAKAQKDAAQVAAVEPKSARWKKFNEANGVSMCDELVKRSAINKGAISLAWTWEVRRDDDTGVITFQRDFDGKNAFGGTISSAYRCSFNADSGVFLHLWVHELTGWKKIA